MLLEWLVCLLLDLYGEYFWVHNMQTTFNFKDCPFCGEPTIIWDNDYDLQDVGYEEEGILSEYHCMNCNAWFEFGVPFQKENQKE